MKTAAPLFQWPTRHRLHLLLPTVLVLAALLHAAVFFLFSIAYPPSQPETSRPAKVFFLPVGSAVRQQIEGLLHSDDPALFAPGHGLPDQPPPFVAEHIPQFDTPRLPLEIVPPPATAPAMRPPQPEPVEIAQPRDTAPGQPPAGTPGRANLSPALAQRLESLDVPGFDSLQASPGAPSIFLVGILPDGRAGHVIPQTSCGDDSLDAAAANALQSARFKASEDGETAWGFVEFHWGTGKAGKAEL